MDIDEKYMAEALKEAHLALEEDEIPIGAVIVCKGRIIGRGHNMTEMLHDPTAASVSSIPKRRSSRHWL